MGTDNSICNCLGVFVSLAGGEGKKNNNENSTGLCLSPASWNRLSCHFMSTQDETIKKKTKLNPNHTCAHIPEQITKTGEKKEKIRSGKARIHPSSALLCSGKTTGDCTMPRFRQLPQLPPKLGLPPNFLLQLNQSRIDHA